MFHEEVEEEKEDSFTYIKINNDVNRTKIERVVKPYATLKYTPFEVACKVFAFFPLMDCINAEKYGSQFLLRTASNYFDSTNAVEATYDVSRIDVEACSNMKSSSMKQ